MATGMLPVRRSFVAFIAAGAFCSAVSCKAPESTRLSDTMTVSSTSLESRSASDTLTVCADPNNLPYSARDGRGLEVELARLLAVELQRPLAIHWRAQRRGVVREGLNAGLCDLLPGTVASSELSLNSRPYYRSTYVFVTRRDGPAAARAIVTLDDPALRTLRIGVHMIGDDYTNTPPAHALASRGIVRNVVGYSLYGDYALPDPPLALLEAVVKRDIDMAIVWGPFAGWYAKHDSSLVWRAVSPAIDLPFLPFVYDIAMGVRRSDAALRDSIDAVLARRIGTVDSLLASYGVPRVDRLPSTAGR